ncbi:hypothetical protein QCA50_018912 [Cerrena zonata]|uniref:Uncharacterized protein n=1 Tax=Cerrena zonata TaxID=2478898 RepID=A0AAW0FF77_9APHY
MDHWASDPNCPKHPSKGRPAVRRITEAPEDDPNPRITDSGEPEELSGPERQDQDDVEHAEGSQYDPDDEYPEELYGDYPEDDDTAAWMGGMRAIPEELLPPGEDETEEDDFPTEQLCGMRLRGELPTPSISVNIGLNPNCIEPLPRMVTPTPAEYELQLEHYRNITDRQQYQLMSLRNQITELRENGQRTQQRNTLWTNHLDEMNMELRRFCTAIQMDNSQDVMLNIARSTIISQNRRATERENAVRAESSESSNSNGETSYSDMPTLESRPDTPQVEIPQLIPLETGGQTGRLVYEYDPEDMQTRRLVYLDDVVETLRAIKEDPDWEYRTAMAPKEVRPQRAFRCITIYVEVNGMKGLALLDSGSSIDCVSPEFTRIARLPVVPLDKPALDRSPNFGLHKSKVKF